ncbi:MAG: DUF2339 domain-containing protein [Pseudomonadota bacterium]
MVIWGILLGALLGAMWPGYGDWQMYAGAFWGFWAGLSLRWVVRREVRKEMARAVVSAGKAAHSAQTVQQPAVPAAAAAPVQTQEILHELMEPELDAAPVSMVQPADSLSVSNAELRSAAAPQPVPEPPAQPMQANAVERTLTQGVDAAKAWLLGGNTIVRIGLVILFVGLSFLARYAAVAGLFPVELRLAGIAAAGIAMLVFGFRKRTLKPGFALLMQGGGVAVMYLTVFAAFRLYNLLPPLPAFGLMLLVCALSCALALLQDSRALAVAAFAGGFATPILLSTGQGSHVGLFSYYTVLNLAILFIAYKRSWRVLNLLGFVATFGVATAWGALKYQPENYASAQPFLLVFVLIYVFTAVLYARNTPTRLGNAVDSTLVFGTPLAGFGLQAGLVQAFDLGAAFSALGFASIYLLLAAALMRRAQGSYRLLVECFIALGVGFATLAVPLGLDVRWTSAVWALEGAGAFWVGMRQARWMPRAFGLLLQAVAALAFLGHADSPVSNWPLLNPAFIGALLIALPAFVIAWWLRKPLPHSDSGWARVYAAFEIQLASPVYLYGFGFWCAAWLFEITRQLPALELGVLPSPVFGQSAAQLLAMLALVLSAWLSQVLGLRTSWPVATWPSRLSLPIMFFVYLLQADIDQRVLYTPAWLVWVVVLGLHLRMLQQNDVAAGAAGQAPGRLSHWLHVGGAWLLTLLLADCLWFWIGRGGLWQTSWASVVLLISAIAVLLCLAGWAGRAARPGAQAAFSWPLNLHAAAYYWHAALPLALLVFAGALLMALHSSGRTEPLPYIPLLNPTDLTLALALGALLFWRRVLLAAQLTSSVPARSVWVCGRGALTAMAALAFVALNTVWLRVAHHFFGVTWDASALFGSFVVQTGYAILWTLLALSLMVLASRRVQRQGQRSLWLVGAGLLGLVVVKLLLIDLSNVGGAERIITFIAVGVLMLVVGYFAPLPPKSTPEPVGEDTSQGQSS